MNAVPLLSKRKLWVLILSLCLYTCTSPEGPARSIAANDLETIRLPVKVYLLSFDAEPKLNSTFGEREVSRLFSEVNAVWGKWGIEWVAESVSILVVDSSEFHGVSANETKRGFRNKMAAIAPAEPGPGIWQVAILRQFPVLASGVYIPEKNMVLYGELNKNGEYFPVVLAHEFGHSLGLKHEKSKENLMYGGQSKDPGQTLSLNTQQIDQAKAMAKAGEHPNPSMATRYEDSPGKRSNTLSSEQRKNMARRLNSFDSNGDGQIDRAEVPAKASNAFARIDLDGNGSIDKHELDYFSSAGD